MATKPQPGRTVVATNRQARRDFEIVDTWEAGLVLQGSEVKSLRESKVQISDCYGRVDRGEVWLVGLHIAPYSLASAQGGHDPERQRKLLLHRHEVDEISARVGQEHLSLVPLALYFRGGRAKLELGLGRGRKTVDKRRLIAERDAALDAKRAMAARSRR